MGGASIITDVVVESKLNGRIRVRDVVLQLRLGRHARVSSECFRLSIIVVSELLPGRRGVGCGQRATYVMVTSRLVLRRGTDVAVLRDVPLVGERMLLRVGVLLRHVSETRTCTTSATKRKQRCTRWPIKRGRDPRKRQQLVARTWRKTYALEEPLQSDWCERRRVS